MRLRLRATRHIRMPTAYPYPYPYVYAYPRPYVYGYPILATAAGDKLQLATLTNPISGAHHASEMGLARFEGTAFRPSARELGPVQTKVGAISSLFAEGKLPLRATDLYL